MKRGRPQNLKRLAEVDEYTRKGLNTKEIALLMNTTRQVVEYYKSKVKKIKFANGAK